MAWKDADRDMGGQPILKFEKDGESIRMVVCGEPNVIDTDTFGQKRKRAVFLVIVNGELMRWFTSGKTFREIRPFSEKLADNALIATRHGDKKDIATTYSMKIAKLTAAEKKERSMLIGDSSDSEDMPF